MKRVSIIVIEPRVASAPKTRCPSARRRPVQRGRVRTRSLEGVRPCEAARDPVEEKERDVVVAMREGMKV